MQTAFTPFLSKFGAISLSNNTLYYEPSPQEEGSYNAHLELCPLINWTWLKVSGEDAQKFLQGQITYDVNALSEHHGAFAAQCNRKGQTIATFYIFLRHNAYYLHLPSASAVLLQKALKSYALFSKVNIELLEDYVSIGLAGKDSDKALRQILGLEPPALYQQYTHASLDLHHIPGNTTRLICSGSIAAICDFWQTMQSHHPLFISNSKWQYYDIDCQLPFLDAKTTALFTPHALSLTNHHGISFTKGCYTGQEIIARMHYLASGGKRTLSYREYPVDVIYQPGDALLDEQQKSIGTVISVYVDTLENKQYILAVLDQS